MPRMITKLITAPRPEDFAPLARADAECRMGYARGGLYHLWRTLRDNKLAMLCGALLVLILLSAVFASLSPYDPDYMEVTAKMQSPSAAHWLGTDDLGRDSLTRALYGGRVGVVQ